MSVNVKALRERWVCNQHGGYCYILPSTTKHIKLGDRDLGDWAAAIPTGWAAINNPPRSIEFEDLIYGRSKRSTPRIDNTSTASLPFIQNINYPNCTHSTESNSSLSIKSKISPVSPLRGIKPQEYTNNGLKMFLSHCSELYDDESYADFLDTFRTKKVGVDTFKFAITDQNATREVIKQLETLGVTLFAAQRMITTFDTWYKEISHAASS